MKCWEYKSVTADSCGALLDTLQRLGRERYMLVCVVPEIVENEMPQYVAIIMRDYDPYDVGGISHP